MMEGVLLVSVDSDGPTVAHAATRGMKARSFLARHDAYAFFAPLGDLVVTGSTRNQRN